MAHRFYEYEYKYEYLKNVLEYMNTRVPSTSALCLIRTNRISTTFTRSVLKEDITSIHKNTCILFEIY